MQKNSAQFVAYAIAVLMFMTGILYLSVAYGENNESVEKQTSELKDHSGTSSAQREIESKESEIKENGRNLATSEKVGSEGVGPILETMFFSSVGVAYVPVGAWMIGSKDKSTKPIHHSTDWLCFIDCILCCDKNAKYSNDWIARRCRTA